MRHKYASVSEINEFLQTLKSCKSSDIYFYNEREENEEALSLLGYTPKHAIEKAKTLNYKDYSKGPEEDRNDKNANVWFFGKYIKSIEIYIKFSIGETRSKSKIICYSFHLPKWKIEYPYKETD